MMVRQSEVIKHYSNPAVAAELIRVSQDREVSVQLRSKGYGKRPSVLQFPAEVKDLVRSGATSFHMSEERWSDPMQLRTDMNKRELNDLRIGWDFIIDIDCPWFEYSTIAASVLLDAIKQHGVKAALKFSGNRGWHIGIPFEAFPAEIGRRKTESLFPAITATIITYLKQYTESSMSDRIIEFEGSDVKNILKRTGRKKEDFMVSGKLDIFTLIELDLALSSSRHLIRAPYSIHEKTGLISIVIDPDKLNYFKREHAKPENIAEINDSFLNPSKIAAGSASQLLTQALDFEAQEKSKANSEKVTVEFEPFEGKVPKEKFPPCVKNILAGLEDGRKRSLFVLMNFLKSVGWPWPDIENEVREWNLKNKPPMKDGYLNSQLKWSKQQSSVFPPPNCADVGHYKDTGICKPDKFCEKIKNPLTYVKRQLRFSATQPKRRKKKKSEAPVKSAPIKT